MGRKCCMPNCRSNYNTEHSYTPSFQFPKDEARRQKWINAIKREFSFVPSKTAVVCVLHFEDKFVIREDRATRDDGTILVVPRAKLALTPDAHPTKFPNCPEYMNKTLPQERKSPLERHAAVDTRDEEIFQQWCKNDVISSFDEFKNKISTHQYPKWKTLISSEYILFYHMRVVDCPKIIVSVKILQDLGVQIWHSENELCLSSFEYILGNERRCNLWTKFDCLLNKLLQYDLKVQSNEEKILNVLYMLQLCIESMEDKEKLQFLKEQISLLLVKKVLYTPVFLIWCAKFFYSYPAAYIMVRDSNILTMPHPSYLKKLSAALRNPTSASSHISYLKKKATLLSENERIVNVLLDEIYITPSIDYTGGHLLGAAANNDAAIQAATTMQTFMISSVFGKNKDVVSLIPVKNLNAEKLYAYTKEVLKILFECGYTSLCLISDNNRINRNMFNLFCCSNESDLEQTDTDLDKVDISTPGPPPKKQKANNSLKHSIPHPYCSELKLFFLFDTPHLLKSIRNNWLNQKDENKTFYYPDPERTEEFYQANMSHLINIYNSEKTCIIKTASKLCAKVLFPSSFERQTVLFAANLFHESNSTALNMSSDQSTQGTKVFIDYINKWWKIVNVKQHEKGQHKRDVACEPISGITDANMQFLQEFYLWLKAWGDFMELKAKGKKEVNLPTKGGFLSKETQFSLQFTTGSLIELVTYVFEKYIPNYLLLGKFQTDSLEGRFGQYRQMNGGNYSISTRQVLEAEHKLKILSLISLHSEKLGDFKLKYFELEESDQPTVIEIPEQFFETFNTRDEEIPTSTMSVLIYVAGYVVHSVTAKLKCVRCISVLVENKPLECEIPSDSVNQYLLLTSRGGLKWPKRFTVNIVICAYEIFKKLISVKYEHLFIAFKDQRNLIVALTLEKLDLLGLINEDICNCKVEHVALAKKVVWVISNILLNNYTKVFNDRKQTKKRKLSTFSK